ncbi:hypothetical protein [Treponema endosymbiont of Eucomonympha sp.]|uniref:hypothetical protein n=1 Tax=Treponema endosymbiont of Eucomonympha sp. TaxID=1580831 RepID=UPI001396989F|nr:hypothetical protein [Treponema endosymbiont of Eucomonympha sp.]
MQSSPLPSSPPFMSGVCSSTFQSTLPSAEETAPIVHEASPTAARKRTVPRCACGDRQVGVPCGSGIPQESRKCSAKNADTNSKQRQSV